MSIAKVLDRSYKIAYDEHVMKLLSVPEKYLAEVAPNKQIPYSDLFKSYNSDIAECLNDFGSKLLSETMKALSSKGSSSIEDKDEILNSLEKYLNPELYIKRFDIFVESIGRTLSRYSLIFDVERNRIDIPKSLAEVHSKNMCRKIHSKISNEIDVFLLANNKAEVASGIYGRINNLYNNHQFLFWGASVLLSVILGVLLV